MIHKGSSLDQPSVHFAMLTCCIVLLLLRKDYVCCQHTDCYVFSNAIGCNGTTRLPGAGKTIYKEGALFGPPKLINTIATINKSKAVEEDDYRLKYSSKRKEALVAKEDIPVVGLKSNKNFITANAVEAILQGASCLRCISLLISCNNIFYQICTKSYHFFCHKMLQFQE